MWLPCCSHQPKRNSEVWEGGDGWPGSTPWLPACQSSSDEKEKLLGETPRVGELESSCFHSPFSDSRFWTPPPLHTNANVSGIVKGWHVPAGMGNTS